MSKINPFDTPPPSEEEASSNFNFDVKSNNAASPFDNVEEERKERTLVEVIKEIERKDTNYIFLFGKRATGKSYITASLIYYMKTCRLGDLHVASSNSRDAEVLIEHMYQNFHSGKPIDRTNRNAPPYEIDLVFTPKDKRLPKMRITFLEMSGENLEKIQISKTDPKSGTLPDDIDIYFMCHNIKLIFFLVADHQTASEDSLAINKFLDYTFNRDEKFDISNYLLAITKWDTYNGRHKNIENFTEEVMPNIHNRLINEREGNAITHYSIGKVIQKDDKGSKIELIKEVDISRAEAVTNWLYKTITKKSLIPEPTRWEKIKLFFGI